MARICADQQRRFPSPAAARPSDRRHLSVAHSSHPLEQRGPSADDRLRARRCATSSSRPRCDFTSNHFSGIGARHGQRRTSTFVPALSAPSGNNNGAGARTAGGSSVNFGADNAPFVLTSNEAVGISGSADQNVTTGDIVMSFPQPVTSVTISYGNFPLQSGESNTGQQRFGISQVRFCPMPAIAIAKTSAPYITTAGSPDRFNAPGSDVAYTLTVTNSGGSPVDLSTLVLTDILPANVTFYNGDYNAARGHGPFELTAGSSGVTLQPRDAPFRTTTARPTPTCRRPATTQCRCGTADAHGQHGRQFPFTIRFRARIN